ncbi:MAG: CoxG family protein [Saprospiraceae bacterium]
MRLNGTHTLPANPQQIWDLLMDAKVLAKITPGVSRLEPLGGNKYMAVSDVKLGPVKGTFKGEMEVAEPVEPERFTLLMKQNSKIGNVNAKGHIILNPVSDQQTEVEFSGEAKLSGTLARTGQRVLTGVANSMTNQFFKSLGEEIEARHPASVVESKEDAILLTGSGSSAAPATGSGISAAATIEQQVPQVVKDTIQHSSETGAGMWQRFSDWVSNLFK